MSMLTGVTGYGFTAAIYGEYPTAELYTALPEKVKPKFAHLMGNEDSLYDETIYDLLSEVIKRSYPSLVLDVAGRADYAESFCVLIKKTRSFSIGSDIRKVKSTAPGKKQKAIPKEFINVLGKDTPPLVGGE